LSLYYIINYIEESPKFLYNQKKYDESREVLKRIAATNGIQMFDFRFEDESDSPTMTKQVLYDPAEETSLINSTRGNSPNN
jgi:hypothetical protein